MDNVIVTDSGAPQIVGRLCRDCGKGISERHIYSFRCAECQREFTNASRRRTLKPRSCEDCEADITHRGPGSTRCVECQEPVKRQKIREKEWRRRGAVPICVDCGADTSGPEQWNSIRRCRPCQDVKDAVVHKEANKKYGSKPEVQERRRKRERARNATPEGRAKKLAHKYTHRKKHGRGYRRHLTLLIARQQSICPLCRQPLGEVRSLIDVDHIIPNKDNSIDNLEATHLACNRRKSNRIVKIIPYQFCFADSP